jgi:hypothetical protein
MRRQSVLRLGCGELALAWEARWIVRSSFHDLLLFIGERCVHVFWHVAYVERCDLLDFNRSCILLEAVDVGERRHDANFHRKRSNCKDVEGRLCVQDRYKQCFRLCSLEQFGAPTHLSLYLIPTCCSTHPYTHQQYSFTNSSSAQQPPRPQALALCIHCPADWLPLAAVPFTRLYSRIPRISPTTSYCG